VTRLALLLAVAALLAPAGASAKELVAATVCGASGCRTVTDRAMLNEIPGGEEVTGLGAPAAYYRLNLVTAEPNGRRHGFTTYYVPSAKAMSWSEDGLYRLHPIYGQRANGVMRRITTGLEPYAAPRNLRSSRPLAVDRRQERARALAEHEPRRERIRAGAHRRPDAARGVGSRRPLAVGRARGGRRSRRRLPRRDSAFQVVIQQGKKPRSPSVLRMWDDPKTARLPGSRRLPRAFLHL
jgi:hypothetical protein